MKNMINVGNEVKYSKESFEAIAAAITNILKTGAETHTEQETIRLAITTIGKMAQVENVSITNSTFMNHPPAPPSETTTDAPYDPEEEDEGEE